MRTRDAVIKVIHHLVQPEEVELIRRDYSANGGWETFLAYEDPRQVCQHWEYSGHACSSRLSC